MATWVIIAASPHANGKCQAVAQRLADELNAREGSTASFFSAVSYEVHGCIGCDECKEDGKCIYSDDVSDIMRALEASDAAFVISPLYFAGVPSQFKALLDRFQPYYWKCERMREAGERRRVKRPLLVAFVGEGGDPYGSEHASALVASPFALADFKVEDCETYLQMSEEEIYSSVLPVVMKIESEVGA